MLHGRLKNNLSCYRSFQSKCAALFNQTLEWPARKKNFRRRLSCSERTARWINFVWAGADSNPILLNAMFFAGYFCSFSLIKDIKSVLRFIISWWLVVCHNWKWIRNFNIIIRASVTIRILKCNNHVANFFLFPLITCSLPWNDTNLTDIVFILHYHNDFVIMTPR